MSRLMVRIVWYYQEFDISINSQHYCIQDIWTKLLILEMIINNYIKLILEVYLMNHFD